MLILGATALSCGSDSLSSGVADNCPDASVGAQSAHGSEVVNEPSPSDPQATAPIDPRPANGGLVLHGTSEVMAPPITMRFDDIVALDRRTRMAEASSVSGVSGRPQHVASPRIGAVANAPTDGPANVDIPAPNANEPPGAGAAARPGDGDFAQIEGGNPPPGLSASFVALASNNTVVPPDTNGAAGPNNLMVVLNSQIQIQSKTGTPISTSTLTTFFTSLGHTVSLFQPKIGYDPYGQRWIVTAAADSGKTTSAVVLAVSQTTDPTGAWNFLNIPTTGTNSADSPNFGFTKDWVIVTSNLFSNSSSTFMGCHVDVVNKAKLYANMAPTYTRITTTTAQDDFAMQPAFTYDNTIATGYMLEEWNGAGAQDRIDTITGAVGSEVFTQGTIFALPQGAWAETGTGTVGFAPQLGSANKIDTSDARMGNVVYRNGNLWGTHNVFLPSTAPTRSSVQWFEVNASAASIVQSGRIDDTTGANFYAYPSLAVNQFNDMMIGYSHFSAAIYPAADYTMRFNYDALGSLHDDAVLQAGLTSYFNEAGGSTNVYGQYSNTVVDPDDETFWTIQEYAATPANTWGTWWGKLPVDCANGRAVGTGCDSDGVCSTGPKTCQAGAICQGANPVVCTAPACQIAGTCVPTTGACTTPTDVANGTTCNDNNACTTGDTCTSGTCSGTTITCTALDQCHTAGTCSGGACSNPVKANGTACNDGNACTSSDVCTGGTCAGTTVTCGAIDQCHTAGTCNAVTGMCSTPTVANGTGCNDANACTNNDVCTNGTCGGTGITCSPEDQCHTAGVCNAATGMCSNPTANNGTSCNDGNACTSNDACTNGTCGGTAVTCSALDSCHTAGTCNAVTGACSNPVQPNGTACFGSNLCDQSYACQAGTCTGANPVVCTTLDQCHSVGACNPATGTCSNPVLPNGTTCDDGNACTQASSCQSGTCAGSNPVTCTALDVCHVAGACNPASGTCSNPNAPNGTACNDMNVCTQVDSCTNGTCGGSSPIVCMPSDQCHIAGSCNAATGTCSNPVASDGTGCDDSNPCTQADSCVLGVCTGTPIVCTATGSCHTSGTCDPSTGMCSGPAVPDGTSCNDMNACTQMDTCTGGTCVGMQPVTCAPQDQCHAAGTCDPTNGMCSQPLKGDGTSCDDKNACTQTDSCQAGVCTGMNPVSCTAPDDCHTDACDAISGRCVSTQLPDGTTCSDGVCTAGSCGPSMPPPVDGGTAEAGPPSDDGGGNTLPDAAEPMADAASGDSGGLVPPVDAGTHVTKDASIANEDAAANDTNNGTPSDSGGCGCRTAQPRSTPASAWLAVSAIALLGGARLRRRARKARADKAA